MPFPDLRDLAVAWVRSFRPTAAQEELAQYRLAICDTCEWKYWRAGHEEYTCRACGCPLLRKVYSARPGRDACPHQKWDR